LLSTAITITGVREHTDYGFLTILLQDQSGGLQVRSLDGEWIDAPPVDDSFVVNIGDMLELWTHGLYRATPHRVRNKGTGDRLSFPLFFDPNWQSSLAPIDPSLLQRQMLKPVCLLSIYLYLSLSIYLSLYLSLSLSVAFSVALSKLSPSDVFFSVLVVVVVVLLLLGSFSWSSHSLTHSLTLSFTHCLSVTHTHSLTCTHFLAMAFSAHTHSYTFTYIHIYTYIHT
jgi:2OG-Fe(II) oxygenase superfamily